MKKNIFWSFKCRIISFDQVYWKWHVLLTRYKVYLIPYIYLTTSYALHVSIIHLTLWWCHLQAYAVYLCGTKHHAINGNTLNQWIAKLTTEQGQCLHSDTFVQDWKHRFWPFRFFCHFDNHILICNFFQGNNKTTFYDLSRLLLYRIQIVVIFLVVLSLNLLILLKMNYVGYSILSFNL